MVPSLDNKASWTAKNRRKLFSLVVEAKLHWLTEGNKLLSPVTGTPLDEVAFLATEAKRREARTKGLELTRHYHSRVVA